jgi:hypothetical protein
VSLVNQGQLVVVLRAPTNQDGPTRMPLVFFGGGCFCSSAVTKKSIEAFYPTIGYGILWRPELRRAA